MTFKEFMVGTARLPAKILAGIFALVLGDYARNEEGKAKKNGVFRGLLGLILDGFKLLLEIGKAIGRVTTDFIREHQDAIATAFWVSLLVAGAAALTVAFWPAALAAVTGFTVAGYSIASLVGTGFAAQVAATAGVGAVLASAAVYAVAAVVNFFTALRDCFTRKPDGQDEDDNIAELDQESDDDHDDGFGSAPAMQTLGRPDASRTHLRLVDETAPLHRKPVFAAPAPKRTTPDVAPEHGATSQLA
jgi:hypothetical protein